MNFGGSGEKLVEWQVPPRETSGEHRKGWIEELVAGGDRFVKGQQGIRHINDDIRLLMGHDQKQAVKSNGVWADYCTFIETISDISQIATLGAKAEQWKKNVETYNGVFKYIFWDSKFLGSTRKALQWAALGRGYMGQKFSRTAGQGGLGKAKMHFPVYGPFDVLPEQLPMDNDIQGSYAVTIIEPMPIWEAHARFPDFQEFLEPISRYDWKTYGTALTENRLSFYDRWRFGSTGSQAGDWLSKYCEIRRTFVRDLRVNRTGRTMQMGTPGSSWGYVVPSVGDLLVSVNPFNGLPESRKATEEDCSVYPQLRLITTSPTVPVPMYDDTAFDWHGEIPVVQYDVNDVPWSPFGQSMIHSVASLERARRNLLSLNDQTVKINTDPPIGWDYQSGVKPEQLTKLKMLESQGVRIGTKGDPSKALKSVLPEGQRTTGENWKDLEVLTAQIKNDLGLNDIASLRELKMNMSGENFEKFLENLGPIAKGLARTIAGANGKHATMLKSNIAQYISVNDLVDMVGPKGIAIETYDNDPNSLVPGRLPGEVDTADSKFHKRERARWFVEKLKTISTPEQLLDITQQQEQMRYMYLFGKGAKLPTKTYMEKFGITDYETQYEEWKNEQLSEAEWKLNVQAALQAKMKELGLEPPPDQGKGQGQGGGRPNVHSKPPHGETKGSQSGNVRAVVSTS
jgi:hypothetical protein